MTDTDTRAALDAAIDEWIRLRGLSYRLEPDPTPDAAGFSRWSARASQAIAGGRVGWLA